jgi:hypothetical protein
MSKLKLRECGVLLDLRLTAKRLSHIVWDNELLFSFCLITLLLELNSEVMNPL